MIDAEDQQRFAPFLQPGERITWSGRPKQGFVFTFIDIFSIPFSLIFFCGAVMWEGLALYQVDNESAAFGWSFVLFGIPFVFVGSQMLIGRFFTDKRRRAVTYYALTNQRALVLVEKKQPELFAYTPVELFDIQITRRSDNGDVSFGRWKIPVRKRNGIMHWPYGTFSGFRMIADVGEVFEMVVQLRDSKT